MRRRRVTYRPSRAQSAFSGVVGVIFVLIGIFVVIPAGGLFGILWTLIAIGITAMNLYQAFGKNYMGPEINIEEDGAERPSAAYNPDIGLSPEERLQQLQRLYDSGLITPEEYEMKRREIIREL